MNYRDKLALMVMAAELLTLSESNSIMYQVEGYSTTIIYAPIIKVWIIVYIEGNVTRTNVADVEIFSKYSRFVFKENMTVKTVWPGNLKLHNCSYSSMMHISLLLLSGGVLYDGAAEEKLHPLNKALTITSFMMASAGLVFTLVCLLFNIVFRNKK